MTYNEKVVVVTGAGEGIGRSIALHYAQLGAKVVVADQNESTGRETVDLIYDQNGSGIYFYADVTKEKDVKRLMENIIYCYGKIDVLINNVGTTYKKTILNMELQEWHGIMDSNLTSVFLCIKEAVKYMKTARKGAIVNIAASQRYVAEADKEAFAAANGGIISMTKSLGTTLSIYNIQVNSISPGYVDSRNCERLKSFPIQNDQSFDINASEDVAITCANVTKDDNGYVNGSNVVIDKVLIRMVLHI